MHSVGMPSAYSAVSETSATSAFRFRGVFRDVFRHRFSADFFFSFDQKLHVHRQRAVHRAQRFHGFDVHVHLALVVAGSAGVEISVADGGLKRRRGPQLQRIGRLDVVMAVTQHGRLAGRVQPICIDQRMVRGLDDLDIFEAGFAQAVGDEFGGAPDIGGMLGQGADAGNAEKGFQLFKKAVFVGFDECVGGLGHTLL